MPVQITSVKMKEHATATFLLKNWEGRKVIELLKDQMECVEFQHNNQTAEGHNNQTAEEFNN